MGISTVEFVNMGLDHLGKDRIASLAENSVAARKATEIWERVLVSALSRSAWTFARKLASLASTTNDWEERWDYRYDLPNDMVRFLRLVPLVDFLNQEAQIECQILGGGVYCNESPVKAEYVFRQTSTMDLPQYFLDAAALLLARDMAMPLTKKMSIWESLDQRYEFQIIRAAEQDAAQVPTYYPQDDSEYLRARGAGAGNRPRPWADGSSFWS